MSFWDSRELAESPSMTIPTRSLTLHSRLPLVTDEAFQAAPDSQVLNCRSDGPLRSQTPNSLSSLVHLT